MTATSERRNDFVPTASIIAFIFIGVFFLIGLIGRCLALNQSTSRNAQDLDLMIYRAPPPRVNPPQQKPRLSTDIKYDSTDIAVTPAPVQRGPKHL